MARLPKPQRRSTDESSDSNVLAILGVGVAAIIGLLLITGQGPFGGGDESEEPAPIPAGTGTTTPTDAGGNPTKPAEKPKAKPGTAGKEKTSGKKPPAKKKKKGGNQVPAPTPGTGGGTTDQYLDCIAKAKGKKQIQRCVDLIEGPGG